MTTNQCLMWWLQYISYIIKLSTQLLGSLRLLYIIYFTSIRIFLLKLCVSGFVSFVGLAVFCCLFVDLLCHLNETGTCTWFSPAHVGPPSHLCGIYTGAIAPVHREPRQSTSGRRNFETTARIPNAGLGFTISCGEKKKRTRFGCGQRLLSEN